jgi:hypothetical protein
VCLTHAFGEVRSRQTFFFKYPPVTVIALDTTAFFNNSNYLKPKRPLRMDNPETLATVVTQKTGRRQRNK